MITVMNASEANTPMIRQYQDIKSRCRDAILFFRLGDFYEMFYDDAKVASKELELTLTGRGEGEKRMPMCGVPYHAADSYIAKLLSKGYKVAICDQVEDPKDAKGIVKREVVKIITPGTVQESRMLDERSSNFLLAISFLKNDAGIAFIDATTGEFKATSISILNGTGDLLEEIKRISPSEILFPDVAPDAAKALAEDLRSAGHSLSEYKDTYDPDIAQKKLKEHFKVASLESFGMSGFKPAMGAAVAIIEYLKNTQKGALDHVNNIRTYSSEDFMYIDSSTRRNLELFSTVRDRSQIGSLVWVLDRASTVMGSRLLKKWISQPLLDPDEINSRLDAVEEMSKDMMLRKEQSKLLAEISDVERLTGKAASQAANARDLVALKNSLTHLPGIKLALNKCMSKKIEKVKNLQEPSEVIDLIDHAIEPDPPHTLTVGGLIKKGFNEELDKLKEMTKGNKDWIAELEIKERQRTGIKSLKVGFTSVFGYYIEISKANLGSVPDDYIRKQTLVNCERFITPSLKEREALILNAEEKMQDMEYEIFIDVRKQISAHVQTLQLISETLAELDVLLSFATVAAERKYARPVIKEKGGIIITKGRHPVVEATLAENMFVPNDTNMDLDDSRFSLITGPNMAGKSTYMRQVAMICLMAQIGSFVPAASASLPLIDRVFTRIGAMDDIFSGQSTFMVEMTETANIINNATSKSLIILDEIGRGTSTFDGMSIAAAVAEYIHKKIKAYTLFATHYHEITQLADKHAGMKNLSTLVRKEGDKVIFFHKIIDGPADQSYGIEVAKLAGLPDEVVSRAKEIYGTLEMVENDIAKSERKNRISAQAKRTKPLRSDQDQINLF
jgi:DNA mismatch repair protein MutS